MNPNQQYPANLGQLQVHNPPQTDEGDLRQLLAGLERHARATNAQNQRAEGLHDTAGQLRRAIREFVRTNAGQPGTQELHRQMVAIFRNSGEHFSSDEEDGDTDYESDETGEDDEEDDEDDEEEHEVVGAAPARPPQATLCPDCSNLDMTPNMRHAVIAGRPVAAVFCFLHSPPFAQNHDQCTSSQLISIQQTTMVMEATHQHDHGHYDLVDVQPHRNIPQFPVHPPPAAPAQQPVAVNALMALPRHRRQTSANAFHPYAQRPQRQQDQDQQQQQYPHYKEPQNYPQSEYWPQPQQYPPQQQYPQQQRYPAQQQPGMYTQGYDPQNSTFAMPRQIGYFPQDYFGPINTRGNRGNGPAGNRGYRRFG